MLPFSSGGCRNVFPGRRWVRQIYKLVVNGVFQAFDQACEARVGFHFFLDALDGVHDGGVILAAKTGTDALQADGGELAHQEHGYLAGLRDFLGAAARFDELGLGNFVVLRYGMEHGVKAYAAAERRCDFGDDFLSDVHVDVVAHEARLQCELDDGAFETTYVASNIFSKVTDDFVANFEVAFFGLLVKDGFARLDVRRLDIDGKAPGKAAHEAVGEVFHFGGRGVRCKHDLLACLVQCVEYQEKFVLRFVLACPVLDVVDQENIHFVAVEVGHFRDALFLQALHVLLREVFGREVNDALGRIFFENVVADGLEQVRLAKT